MWAMFASWSASFAWSSACLRASLSCSSLEWDLAAFQAALALTAAAAAFIDAMISSHDCSFFASSASSFSSISRSLAFTPSTAAWRAASTLRSALALRLRSIWRAHLEPATSLLSCSISSRRPWTDLTFFADRRPFPAAAPPLASPCSSS